MIITCKNGYKTSLIPTPVTSTCWIFEMANRNVTVRVVISWVVEGNTESSKKLKLDKRKKQLKSIVNLVTPVAQASEMAKLEIEHKREENDSITGGEHLEI